mgnify:CR=1 FL=1
MLTLRSEKDFYTAVEEALTNIDKDWESYNGVLIMGSHMPNNVEAKIEAIRNARKNKIPFLGICMGLQLAIIEYARNVLDMPLATSEEIGKGILVVKKLPQLRVGTYPVEWAGKEFTLESHWHNYAFNKDWHEAFKKDWAIGYMGEVAEIMELRNHPFFVGTQFHPEYQSSKDKPHKLLVGFLNACKEYERKKN